MSTESEKKGIEASFKSMDTEEFLDIYFNRPIGYAWALFFKKLKVHPNVVTIFSIILGIGAGVMFYYPDMKHTLLGILLLMWANHYDSADGQLARLTGQKTQWVPLVKRQQTQATPDVPDLSGDTLPTLEYQTHSEQREYLNRGRRVHIPHAA